MIEYRVKPVTRYIVTRYESGGQSAGRATERGQFDNQKTAHDVAYAMCKLEHDIAGTTPDDPWFKYPDFMDGIPSNPIDDRLLVAIDALEQISGDDIPDIFNGNSNDLLARQFWNEAHRALALIRSEN